MILPGRRARFGVVESGDDCDVVDAQALSTEVVPAEGDDYRRNGRFVKRTQLLTASDALEADVDARPES